MYLMSNNVCIQRTKSGIESNIMILVIVEKTHNRKEEKKRLMPRRWCLRLEKLFGFMILLF